MKRFQRILSLRDVLTVRQQRGNPLTSILDQVPGGSVAGACRCHADAPYAQCVIEGCPSRTPEDEETNEPQPERVSLSCRTPTAEGNPKRPTCELFGASMGKVVMSGVKVDGNGLVIAVGTPAVSQQFAFSNGNLP